MAGTHRGRHRAPKPSRTVPSLLVLGAVVVVAAAVVGAFSLSADDDPGEPVALPSSTQSREEHPATLQATRVVDVRRETVTVRETTRVVSGGPISVEPSTTSLPVGLRAQKSSIVSEAGTNEAFNKPTSVESGRSITIEGTYRLTDCPDLLPTQWPSPVTITSKEWSRTYIRIEEPQRTAQAICPTSKSKAKPLAGLSGSVQPGHHVVVRLSWLGAQPLTVAAIGSASGVAATAKGGPCQGDCITMVHQHSPSVFRLEPLERCSIGGRANLLTLLVTSGHSTRTARLSLPGLANKVCTS
ncbi:MAG TPA: hypothetical protein VMT88_00360 [Actinomycetes bacterium]|nr:hypothetical protein [Actinomycetes bacterium]